MEKKVLLIQRDDLTLETEEGVYVGTITEDLPSYNNKSEVTLQLIKQGVTVDEIIKLKNQELI